MRCNGCFSSSRRPAYIRCLHDRGCRFVALACVPAPDGGELEGGARVIQARYFVRNPNESWASGLRAVAFTLFNHVRPLGRLRLGWSAGLKGNGMCFRGDVLDRFGWGAASLTEDVEFHARLLQAGLRVTYAPEALVTAEMPTGLTAGALAAGTLGGRAAGADTDVRVTIVALGTAPARPGPARRRRGDYRAAALSRRAARGAVRSGRGARLAGRQRCGSRWACWPRSCSHLVAGMLLARLSMRAYLSLLVAPVYIVWKCWVYFVALLGRGGGGWIRTGRGQP